MYVLQWFWLSGEVERGIILQLIRGWRLYNAYCYFLLHLVSWYLLNNLLHVIADIQHRDFQLVIWNSLLTFGELHTWQSQNVPVLWVVEIECRNHDVVSLEKWYTKKEKEIVPSLLCSMKKIYFMRNYAVFPKLVCVFTTGQVALHGWKSCVGSLGRYAES